MISLRIGDFSVRLHRRTLIILAVLVGAIVAVSVWTMTTGSIPMPLDRLMAALSGNGTKGDTYILVNLRLPRLATALAVGAALGVAGSLFQTLTRNPLGSPDILGITTGASTGALLAILTLSTATAMTITVWAGVGALLTGAIILILARGSDTTGYRIILIGIALAAILSAANSYLITKADIIEASAAVYWLTGDLNGRGYSSAAIVAVAIACATVILVPLARHLETLRLGDIMATGLGTKIVFVRGLSIAVACILAAAAVSVAGPLPFVALAAPHITRSLTKSPRVSLIGSALTGAMLVALADAVAVIGIGDRQLPTGVVTGVVGGMYLIWILVSQRKKATA